MKLRSTLFVLICLITTGLSAQVDKHGCYVSHQGKAKPAALTNLQRAAINESIARSDTFDIIDYEISIDARDYNGKYIEANTIVTLVPKMANQLSVRFDLYQLTVDSVIVDGTLTTFDYDSVYLKVYFPTAVPPNIGDTSRIQVFYNGNPHRDPNWGGFYFASGIVYNLGIGLTTIPPNFGKVWYPCFDSFVERATYTYHVTTGQGRKAWCQGDFLGETVLQGDTVMRSFRFDHPIPTHASAIAAANYAIRDSIYQGAYGPVPFRLQGFPNQIANMESRMVDMYSALDALEYWYGPNPFNRVAYTQTTDGALEIPECIAFPISMTSQSNQANRELLAHELGHYWWGDHVTPFNHNDMWLKEGPAEYSQHLVEEWIDGRDGFLDMIKDNLLFILESAHINDNGYQPMSPMPDPEIYGTHTYYKGAAMMHNMRGYLGDTLFRDAMMGMQQIMSDQTITPEQLRDSIGSITGYDLSDFFDDWIFQPGYSVFTVDDWGTWDSLSYTNVNITLRQLLNNANHLHNNVPVDITCVSATGQRHTQTFVVGGQFSQFTMASPFYPSYIVVNDDQRLHMSKLDYEIEFDPGSTVSTLLPYVDMRFYNDVVTDTTRCRFEHIYAGPSADLVGFGIEDISETHYWNIDGDWPAGSAFRGRFQYDGNANGDLDFLLLSGRPESDIRLVYRPDPQSPWEFTANTNVIIGNPSDRTGFIDVDPLQIGQYAFAAGDAVVNIIESDEDALFTLGLYPIPAKNEINVSASLDGSGLVYFRVFDLQGKQLLVDHAHLSNDFTHNMALEGLAPGSYLMEVRAEGQLIGTRKFVVE